MHGDEIAREVRKQRAHSTCNIEIKYYYWVEWAYCILIGRILALPLTVIDVRAKHVTLVDSCHREREPTI